MIEVALTSLNILLLLMQREYNTLPSINFRG